MFGSQLSAKPNSRLEPLDLERHELPAPTALSVAQWMGHFKRLKTKSLEGSVLLNHQEFLISQDLRSGFRATDGRE